MTREEALVKLGDSTAEVVLVFLRSLCPDGVERGAVVVLPGGASPLESISYPVVASEVSYVDGVTGGNVFATTSLGARRLAAAMMFQELPTADSGEELDELELSALGEAMNQMMAAAAAALGQALDAEVEISVPQTRLLSAVADAQGLYSQTPHATVVSFTLLGEPGRLIQLVPNAFIVRMTRALDDRAAEQEDVRSAGAKELTDSAMPVRDFRVRVGAELGRARLPLGRAVALAANAVIELDRAADDPVDLYVNGCRFAIGRLLLIDQATWAIRVERVLDVAPAALAAHQGGI